MNNRSTRNLTIQIATATVLALAALACNVPAPSPPPLPPPPTAPPSTDPTAPPPESTPTPPAGWLPNGTIAIYAAGTWDGAELYALSTGGPSTALAAGAKNWQAISASGRWAGAADRGDTAPVVIANLETGATYEVPVAADHYAQGLAFDSAETKLAFLELGPLTAEGTTWAIVVVSLADGSATRFPTTMGPEHEILPGSPVGWSTAGDRLILDTFVPFTEGGWAGVWSVDLPPDAPAVPFTELGRRELLAAGAYLTTPRLAPDGTRLLYLSRDPTYWPDGYEPMGYDLMVHQVGRVALPDGPPETVVDVTDGGALERAVAWAPDSVQILFIRGVCVGETLTSPTLKIYDGDVRDVAPLSLAADSYVKGLHWCAPDLALIASISPDNNDELHTLDLTSGTLTPIESAEYVTVLGCITNDPQR